MIAGWLAVAAGSLWLAAALWPHLRSLLPFHLLRHPAAGAVIGAAVGAGVAWALRDPGWAAWGAASGWVVVPWWRRRLERARQRRAVLRVRPFLQGVLETLEVGMHPAMAMVHSRRFLDPDSASALDALMDQVSRGAPFGPAVERWGRQTRVPVLRVYAAFCSAWATWGVDLTKATGRLLRELDAQARAESEVQVVRAAHEWLSWVFIALTAVMAVAAVMSWPAGVTPPWESTWGRGLFTAMAAATALAVWLPDTLSEDLDADHEGGDRA